MHAVRKYAEGKIGFTGHTLSNVLALAKQLHLEFPRHWAFRGTEQQLWSQHCRHKSRIASTRKLPNAYGLGTQAVLKIESLPVVLCGSQKLWDVGQEMGCMTCIVAPTLRDLRA